MIVCTQRFGWRASDVLRKKPLTFAEGSVEIALHVLVILEFALTDCPRVKTERDEWRESIGGNNLYQLSKTGQVAILREPDPT